MSRIVTKTNHAIGQNTVQDLRHIPGLAEWLTLRSGGVFPNGIIPAVSSGEYLSRVEIFIGGGGSPAPTIWASVDSGDRAICGWTLPGDDGIMFLGDFNVWIWSNSTSAISANWTPYVRNVDGSRTALGSMFGHAAGGHYSNFGFPSPLVPISHVVLTSVGTTVNHKIGVAFTGWRLTI